MLNSDKADCLVFHSNLPVLLHDFLCFKSKKILFPSAFKNSLLFIYWIEKFKLASFLILINAISEQTLLALLLCKNFKLSQRHRT